VNHKDRWLLPAGITEVLPPEAAHFEQLHRRLVNLYTTWGYELVIPPMIEYLESLLVGVGDTLELQTFKLIDQLTGRMMGIRADMTPQIARIDAHHLKREVPTRLCYLGTVLHTRPNKFAGSRSPLQVGAELYGYAGVAGDVEIISLMLETLQAIDIKDFHIDIGHVGIYRTLIQEAQLNKEQETQLFDAIKRKAIDEIDVLLGNWHTPCAAHEMLYELAQLDGKDDILHTARRIFNTASDPIHQALDDLVHLSEQLGQHNLYFDLAELRGYTYHTGIVFTAYVPQYGQAIAKGGRYDIGKMFGRSRPATGFSTNLRALASFSRLPDKPSTIFAPAINDPQLKQIIAQLRQQKQLVICELPEQIGDAKAMGCDRELRLINQNWQVVELNTSN